MHQPFVAWPLPEAFPPPPKELVSLKMPISYLGPKFWMILRNYSKMNSKTLVASLALTKLPCQVGGIWICTENTVHEVKLSSRMNLNIFFFFFSKSGLISAEPFAFHYILIET